MQIEARAPGLRAREHGSERRGLDGREEHARRHRLRRRRRSRPLAQGEVDRILHTVPAAGAASVAGRVHPRRVGEGNLRPAVGLRRRIVDVNADQQAERCSSTSSSARCRWSSGSIRSSWTEVGRYGEEDPHNDQVADPGRAGTLRRRSAALGQHGVNIMEFCKAFNAQTAQENGRITPVEITVYEDRSFTFITNASGGGADQGGARDRRARPSRTGTRSEGSRSRSSARSPRSSSRT